jgi:protease-4
MRNLAEFRDDKTVRGFIIEIRSPGGVAGTAQSMYTELARLRDQDDRPVVAWIGEVGASGGYYVALGADSILALPSSITGSIGVIMEFPNAEEFLRKAGVGLEVVKSGDLKDLGSPVRSPTDEERRVLQELVDDVYEQFVGAVSENRRMDRASVVAVADGRVMSGAAGAKTGLLGCSSRSRGVEAALPRQERSRPVSDRSATPLSMAVICRGWAGTPTTGKGESHDQS